ncbi:MAG TPA: hypothetical protein PK691_07910 [Thermomicrobiales bacterium]|nr:hypothetical protein [Thermomicrobiales bacterium]HRA48792.1 hypothetical protein [Thermomicrobiales bacterium]
MKFEYIKEAEAPVAPKPVSRRAHEILEVINGLKDGQVAKIVLEPHQSVRGLKTSFGRVASGRGMKVRSWSVPGEQIVYVKRVK